MFTIGQNKNGTGSYSFSDTNYYAGKCGQGYKLKSSIPYGDATYDSARANMREPWMMPTKDQLRELIDNTDHEWTTINEIKGRKFTSKKDTSKYIFLPAGGWWYETSREDTHSIGYYWSRSWYSENYEWHLELYSGGAHLTDGFLVNTGYYRRYAGYSIRAIRPLTW